MTHVFIVSSAVARHFHSSPEITLNHKKGLFKTTVKKVAVDALAAYLANVNGRKKLKKNLNGNWIL